jgi:hypothetical protein
VLAAKTRDRLGAILSSVFRAVDLESVRPRRREQAADVRVESVGQAAAGALLLSIAIVELVLGFWAAGWHHRAIAFSMAGVGLAFLASGIAEIATAGRKSPHGAGAAGSGVRPDRAVR